MIELNAHTSAGRVPIRILALGKTGADRIDADVFLLTDRAPAFLPSPTVVPERSFLGTSVTWRDVALINPMARFVMAYRNVLYDVRLPGFETMLWLIGWSVAAFFLGLRFFARRADYFAEAM